LYKEPKKLDEEHMQDEKEALVLQKETIVDAFEIYGPIEKFKEK
jgi:hypothetical protein